ncbi:MAG: putative porin [Acidobacteriota bacterium]|nr:putative porin [Acidobacteriota bacterium]
MKSIFRQAIAVMALGAICAAQPLPPSGDDVKSAKSTKKTAAASVTGQELKELKEALAKQQAQIDALERQNQKLEQQLQQNSMQLQDTQGKLATTEKTAADAQAKAAVAEEQDVKVKKVEADLADVRTTLTSSALQTQDEQKRTAAVEGLLSRFRMSGDIRLRYENFTQAKNDSANAAKTDFERNRPRVRVRFAIDGKLNQNFVGGFALATGAINDPTSPNQTLGDSMTRKAINIDRGYITYHSSALKGLSITGGKWAFNWQKTNQTFDPDINPDGFNERYSRDLNSPVFKNITLHASQLFLNEKNSTTTGGNRDESWALVGGVQAKLQLGKYWAMTPSWDMVGFLNPNYVVNGASTTANAGTTPNWGGNLAPTNASGFAPNGMTNCVTTKVQYGSSAPALCSDFLYNDIIVNNTIKTAKANLPVNVMFEFEQNLGANASTGGLSGTTAKTAAENKKRNTLIVLDASVGQQKAKGDFQVGYSFIRSEQDAVLASFAESDQFQPTNALNHKLYFNYRIANNTTLAYTQWIGHYLDFNLTPSNFTKNTWLYRGQLDAIYSF